MRPPDLSVDLGRGLVLTNPVLPASGTFGYGLDLADLCPPERLGAVVTKGLSLRPSTGNRPPRVVETASGMLNAIGLENIGVERFITDICPELARRRLTVICNIYGTTEDEYAAVAERLTGHPAIRGLEVNISCPNVRHGGIAFGTDPGMAAGLISRLRRSTPLHLMVKLSPNVTDIGLIARAVADAGADSLSCINTLLGMAVDLASRRPLLANVTGGLSGPAIKPVALRMVWQTARSVSIPVVGIGGICTPEDALEFIVAGAHAVQVGTATFVRPSAAADIALGIARWCQENGIRDLSSLRGTLSTSAGGC